MSIPLQSDLGTAKEHSGSLSTGADNLADIPQVSAGSTNDVTNQECTSSYEAIRSSLNAYLIVADRDAKRIQEIGLHFADVDAELSSGL